MIVGDEAFSERLKEIAKRVYFISSLGRFVRMVPPTLNNFEIANKSDNVIHLKHNMDYITIKLVEDTEPNQIILKYSLGEMQEKIDILTNDYIYYTYPAWQNYDFKQGTETTFTIDLPPDKYRNDHDYEELVHQIYSIIDYVGKTYDEQR